MFEEILIVLLYRASDDCFLIYPTFTLQLKLIFSKDDVDCEDRLLLSHSYDLLYLLQILFVEIEDHRNHLIFENLKKTLIDEALICQR